MSIDWNIVCLFVFLNPCLPRMEKKSGKKQSTLKAITHHTIQKYDEILNILSANLLRNVYTVYTIYAHIRDFVKNTSSENVS